MSVKSTTPRNILVTVDLNKSGGNSQSNIEKETIQGGSSVLVNKNSSSLYTG